MIRRWIRSLIPVRRDVPVLIDRPQLASNRGAHRVSIRVDGEALWFESSDVELAPNVEAFATALLVPSLSLGRLLEVRGPVCPVWLENQRQAARLTASWWNFPQLDSPHVTPAHALIASAPADSPTPAPRSLAVSTESRAATRGVKDTALCFTGGVDSFYTLLRAQPQADRLVFALGYDVDLRDHALRRSAERTVRAVAAEMGKTSVVIASNLRRHPVFRVESWERTHGGALGAIGHLLSDHISLLQISASYLYGSSAFWGSRWDLDPLFASSQFAIEHFGAEYMRTQKLWMIAHEPIVRRHLRVCWVRHRGEGNCGRCEKCVRTMLVLEACGQLEHYPTLGRPDELIARIDGVPAIPWGAILAYDLLMRQDLRSDVRRAVERLLERTQAASAATAQKTAAA